MSGRSTAAPVTIADRLARAAEFFQYGKFAEAEALYRRILQSQPSQFDALLMLGVVKARRGDRTEAVRLLGKAASRNPASPVPHLALGDVLHDAKQPAAALASYDRALAIAPDHADAHNNRATALRDLGRHAEALAGYDRALDVAPGFVEACTNRGNLLAEMGRPAEALASYDRALALAPAHELAWFGRGNALAALERHEAAVAAFDRALRMQPDNAEAWFNRGNSLRLLRRHDAALASYDRAAALRPMYPEVFNNTGLLLMDLERPAEAVVAYDRALALRPAFPDALFNRGLALRRLQRFDAALPDFEAALRHQPDYLDAVAMGIETRRHLCNWEKFERDRGELERRVRAGQPVPPFITLCTFDAPELHLLAARGWMAKLTAATAAAEPARPGPWRHDRIRIGYVSADFRAHPVAFHIARLIELHDRDRFEVVGISLGRSDGDAVRGRLEAAFDGFIDAAARTDRDTAQAMREREIDIAVDLMGHTTEARPLIFAHRAAPVQVSWLGYPGTTGAAAVDAVIADATVIRAEDERWFSERIVRLPGCYQPNEPGTARLDAANTRASLGLPGDGIVFGCFNQPYKITPDVFAIWMRLLHRVPGSCLWLYAGNQATRGNLRDAAARHGVAAGRLVFADAIDRDRHLARIGHADLFLDTLPYGAHSTASDAFRAGVPLVTCSGRAFQTRVGESLLRALDVPELVTRSLEEYEALALRLAGDADQLGVLKQRIVQAAAVSTLFDAAAFCRNLESAFIALLKN